MNVFKVNIKHTSKVFGQAENEETIRSNLADFISQLHDAEILSVEDMGDSDAFFEENEGDLIPILTEATTSPTLN